jgi:hypothetical protein
VAMWRAGALLTVFFAAGADHSIATASGSESSPRVVLAVDDHWKLPVSISNLTQREICLSPGEYNSYTRISLTYRHRRFTLRDPIIGRPPPGCFVLVPRATERLVFDPADQVPNWPQHGPLICYRLHWHFGSALDRHDATMRSCVRS